MNVHNNNIEMLAEQVRCHRSLEEAIASNLGGLTMCDGRWRFYQDSPSEPSSRTWTNFWEQAWGMVPKSTLHIGEDVFGNQISVNESSHETYICNHENNIYSEIGLKVVDLVNAVAKHGLFWIDFYNDGSLDIVEHLPKISIVQHFHWVHPLVLGGRVDLNNVCIIERIPHIIGHAKLWRSIQGDSLGTEYVQA